LGKIAFKSNPVLLLTTEKYCMLHKSRKSFDQLMKMNIFVSAIIRGEEGPITVIDVKSYRSDS
jgi:hypothetical protein